VSESFTIFIGEGSRVFRKKYPFGDRENEVSVTCYARQHCIMKLSPAILHYNFPFFHCLESFCKAFSNAFQAILSVEFKFLLKSWSYWMLEQLNCYGAYLV